MPHNRGSLIQIYNDDKHAWETGRCRWVSTGTISGERRLSLVLMRLPRRARKVAKTVKPHAPIKASSSAVGKSVTRAASPRPRRPSLPSTTTTTTTTTAETPSSASLVVAQFVVAYVRPRAAAAPLSAELRAALRLKVVSADALLYSSHQSTPRNGGVSGGGHSAGETASNSFHSPPLGPSSGPASTPHTHLVRPTPHVDAAVRSDSPVSPADSFANASMTTAPFFPSSTGRLLSRHPTQPEAMTQTSPGAAENPMRSLSTRYGAVDHWREVLELEVVGAFRPLTTKDAAPRAVRSKVAPSRQTRTDALNSSFSSDSEPEEEVTTDKNVSSRTPPPPPPPAKTKLKSATSSAVATSSAAAAQSRSAKTKGTLPAPAVVTSTSACTTKTTTTAKPKWRQRMLHWLMPDKSSPMARSPTDTSPASSQPASMPPNNTRAPPRSAAAGKKTASTSTGKADRTRTATTTASSPRLSMMSGSDLHFLQKQAAAMTSTETGTTHAAFEFPPAQRWSTLRLRCRHQRHLFQLLHTYVVQCRRARVDVERQAIAEQRHLDALCSLQSTPAQMPLLSVSAPVPGTRHHLTPPPLAETGRSTTTQWMRTHPTVQRVDWPPFVEYLVDPRNDLRFGRIPPFLWYALARWSTTALYAFERGYLVLSHQRYATRLTRSALSQAHDARAATFRLSASPTPAPTLTSSPSDAAVFAPVHAVSSQPTHHHPPHRTGHGARDPQLDTVTLVVSPTTPFSVARSHRDSTPATPSTHARPKLTSPYLVREAAHSDVGQVTGAMEDSGHGTPPSADRPEVSTSFRDCFMALLDTHVVFMDSFGDVKFHCAMDELEVITYSHICEQPKSTTAAASTKGAGKGAAAKLRTGHAAPHTPDVPPFYPFLGFHVKGGLDEDEEPPLSATFTFLPLVPPSLSTVVDDPVGQALGSPFAPDADGDLGSPFGLITPDVEPESGEHVGHGGAAAGQEADFASQHAFDDEHHAPESAAHYRDFQWRQHGHLCRRQSAFLDAFLALTSRTIVSETLDEHLQGGPAQDCPASPLGVVSPPRGLWLAHDAESRSAEPVLPLHMVELSEKDLRLVLPSGHQPLRPTPASARCPTSPSTRAESSGRLTRAQTGPMDPVTEMELPAFLPEVPGTEEALELLPLSLRLARHPLPLLVEKSDLFMRPIGADDDEEEEDGLARDDEKGDEAGAAFSPDGGFFVPQAPRKRKSELKKGASTLLSP